MRLRVHADDCGVSRGVTDAILRCVDEGPVRGVSLIANGAAFDHAVSELRRRPEVALSVHLNLVEGAPVAPIAEIPLLVDAEGLLRNSFQSLWRAHALAGTAKRARLEAQVRAELGAQARKVRAALGPDVPLRLNSHMHLHHLPFVGHIVAGLCREVGALGLRLVREPFAGLFGAGPADVGKLALLNALGAYQRRSAVAADDWFVGALRMGDMTTPMVDAALRKIHARVGAADASVEILFHPGGAAPGDEAVWARYPWLVDYYFAPCHQREAEVLRSRELRACLARWGSGEDGVRRGQ